MAHAMSLWLTVAMAALRYYMVRTRTARRVDTQCTAFMVGKCKSNFTLVLVAQVMALIACLLVLPGFSLNILRNTINRHDPRMIDLTDKCATQHTIAEMARMHFEEIIRHLYPFSQRTCTASRHASGSHARWITRIIG